MRLRTLKFFSTIILALLFVAPISVFAASYSVSPSTGSFPVGSTFDVQIMLDTKGKSVNALEMSLQFPADKLQLVSPSTGQSIISVWTSQPKFNNAEGRLDLQGGIVGGINTSRGLIATVTFRVKGTGQAILRFLDNSKILLNDGLGTNTLEQSNSAVFSLTLPPPQGPIVASETHPDQSAWFRATSAVLQWATDFGADGYSYVLNKEPVDIPDDVSEGTRTSIAYKSIANGTHYFHIKALRSGVWGGTTHYALNVDGEQPAEFKPEILPDNKTTRAQPLINFATTDKLSGISHYEIKIIPLSGSTGEVTEGEPLFIEADSPFIPPALSKGRYDIVVRAYDKAGNTRDATERLEITTAVFSFIDDEGLQFTTRLSFSWPLVWFLGIILLIILSYLAWKLRRWYDHIDKKHLTKNLPDVVQKQLEELQNYRNKYGKGLAIFLLIVSGSFFNNIDVHAQENVLEPPVISEVSRSISDEEIFYIGGSTKSSKTDVIIYLQDLGSGEAYSEKVISDDKGEWFYRHNSFLSPGSYLLWVQSKYGDELSPPSPQVKMNVESSAFQIGSTRLSLEFVYLILIISLIVALVILITLIISYLLRGKKKQRLLHKEIKEAEESIRRGFAVLRRDVEAELSSIRKAGITGSLSEELKQREGQLLKDLASVERYIGKEIWDVEKAETSS